MVDYKKLDVLFQKDPSLHSHKAETSRHTKNVRLAKLLLPCIAAALLSLLFIIPAFKKSINEFGIDITKPQKGELEKLHVENTVLYITDKDNQIHNFTAENIDETEPQSKLVKISNPEGILPFNNNTWFNVKSPTGFYDQEKNTITLTDNVEMFYSDGMNIQVPYITYDFKNFHGYSDKPIKGDGFIGKLRSESFEFFSKTSVLIFKGKTQIKINEESLKK